MSFLTRNPFIERQAAIVIYAAGFSRRRGVTKHHNRMIKAALFALAMGALVAVDNPARPIDHDVSTALVSVAQLTSGIADVAGRDILTPAIRHA